MGWKAGRDGCGKWKLTGGNRCGTSKQPEKNNQRKIVRQKYKPDTKQNKARPIYKLHVKIGG